VEQDINLSPAQFGLNFRADDTGTLHLTFSPYQGLDQLNENKLLSLIKQLGYGHICLFQNELHEAVRIQVANKDPFQKIIGGHRDGKVNVRISDDRMKASIQLVHPCGDGQPITDNMIQDALNKARIKHGVKKEIIPRLIQDQGKKLSQHLVIAEGNPAEKGRDTQFVPLINTVIERKPRILSDDAVDYRDFGGIATVAPGDKLMKREPATKGVDGVSVTGDVMPAEPGIEKEYKLNDSVALDTNNPEILVANKGGQPVIQDCGALVEDIVNMANIDISTGNIDFDGTVVVKGDVSTGMKVKASGDIHIGGTVEAAQLEAGGEITVGGGIIGHGNVRDDNNQLRAEAGYIKAGGNISAKFVKNTVLRSGDSIMVRDMISHSEVTSLNQVVVGGGSAKAQILGGKTIASMLIKAQIIGSPNAAQTLIEVGVDHEAEARIKGVKGKIMEKEKFYNDIDRMYAYYRQFPDKAKPGIMDRVIATRNKTLQELHDLEVYQKQADEDEERLRRACVIVGSKVYSGVELIFFGNINRTTNEDMERGTFILQDTWIGYRKGKAS
jgi:uncharacterized protein (DUF342 family)